MNRKIRIFILLAGLLAAVCFIILYHQQGMTEPEQSSELQITFNDPEDVIHLQVAERMFDPAILIESYDGDLTVEPEMIDCRYQQILKVRYSVRNENDEKVYYKIVEISPSESANPPEENTDSQQEGTTDPQHQPESVSNEPGCQLVWVVDVPYKPAVTEQIWVVDQPEIEEQGYWQDEYETVKYWWIRTENGEYQEFSNREDYQKKREEYAQAGIAINGGTDYRNVKTGTVWIVVQAYQSEQGHYEEVIVEPEIKEQGHYEKKC